MRIRPRDRYAEPKPYARGEEIELDGDELATAIDAYLVAAGVRISGPSTIRIGDTIAQNVTARVYVDPSGVVMMESPRWQCVSCANARRTCDFCQWCAEREGKP